MKQDIDEGLSELKSMVNHARDLFERMLLHALGSDATAGTCLFATIMCHTLISKFSAFKSHIRGGDGQGDGGVWVRGACHGHYWIEIIIENQIHIVDITADQFGQAKVILGPASDLLIRYVPGDQSTVDEHVANELRDMT